MIKGYVFEEQLYSSDAHALITRKMVDYHDGIFTGFEFEKTADTVTYKEGMALVAGRLLGIVGTESISAERKKAFCRLVIEIDLDKTATDTVFEQAYLKIISDTTKFPDLIYEDMDNGGKICQFELAQFETSIESGIINFVDKREFMDFHSIWTKIDEQAKTLISQLKAEIEAARDGSLYLLKATTYNILTNTTINANTDYTLPAAYVVNSKESLKIFYQGCLLLKDKHYIEIGADGQTSYTIQFKDWSVPNNKFLTFEIR